MSVSADPNDDNVLAGEYVLHLLDAAERQSFETRLRDDQLLRDLVHQWEMQLAPIADGVEEVVPPASLRAAILARIAPAPQKTPAARGWMFGLIGIATAALIAFVMLGPLLRDQVAPGPEFQAQLASSDGTLVLVASVIPATHEIVIDRIAGQAPEGRVLELWLIAEGTSTPVSLGLLEAEGTTRIRVPDAIAPGVRTGTIAVSEEPPGGSPAGTPTGQVLAAGTFVTL